MYRVKGFTLIELMVTIVIVAILASVAIPSYSEYVRKARRTEATTALMGVAAAMEKFLLANNTYPPSMDVLVNGYGTLTGVGGHGLTEVGGNFYTENRHYRVTRTTDDPARGWRLQAIPSSAATQQDKECYFFNIYQNGEIRVQKHEGNAFLSGDAARACLPN